MFKIHPIRGKQLHTISTMNLANDVDVVKHSNNKDHHDLISPVSNTTMELLCNENQVAVSEIIRKLKSELKKANKKIDEQINQEKVDNHKNKSEKDSLNDIIASKNAVIDVMRVKINRYEFAVKEAILFLSKPMDGYDGWLKNKREDSGNSPQNYDIPPAVVAIASGLNAAIAGSTSNHHLPYSPQQTLTPQINTLNPTKPLKTCENAEKIKSNETTLMNTTVATRITGVSSFEIQCLECMRLGLNYLKNAQASVQAMTVNSAGILHADWTNPPNLLKLNIETVIDSKIIDLPSSIEENIPLSMIAKRDLEKTVENIQNCTLTKQQPTSITRTHDLNAKSTKHLQPSQTHIADDEDSDIGTITSRLTIENQSTNSQPKCANCRELMLQVDHSNDTVNYLKRDITTLANQLEEERAARERTQLSKDILEQELEELTAQLFDQANRMVIEEARLRDDLENSNKLLRGELKDWAKKASNRDDELRELKKSLLALDRAKQKSMSYTLPDSSSYSANLATLSSSSSPTSSLQNLLFPEPKRHLAPRLGSAGFGLYLSIPIDGILFSEFQDHIKQIVGNAASQAVAWATMLATPYMRRCLYEDVEPCVLYSYSNPNIQNGSLFRIGLMSASFKKRLLEAVERNTCEIQAYWSSTDGLPREGVDRGKHDGELEKRSEDIWGLASPPPKSKCCVCIVTRECDFRIRFGHFDSKGQQSFSEWTPLCRCCRDRVGAAVDFFSYISQLRTGVGKAGSTILGMFRTAQWLRRRMAVARVGNMALFDGDNIGDRNIPILMAGGSEWEKFVQIMT
ncbi:rab guanine nucleotide exchange factor S2 [Nowakowskiella sp. JEL0078]|nr:rab guanine nucleotide exchange factor S2 [Nowakowskiella sp. JEL0078]